MGSDNDNNFFSGTLNGRFAEVSALLRKQMHENGYACGHINNALSLWDDFVTEELPNFKKPSAYAAAVEYTIARLEDLHDITQSSLAKCYNVSAVSISKNAERIADVLALEHNDTRYVSPPAILSIGPNGVLSSADFLEMMTSINVHPDSLNHSQISLSSLEITRLKSLPTTDESWFGGRRTLDTQVNDQPESFRPDLILWASSESGCVLGQQVTLPTNGDRFLLDTLVSTIREPSIGQPRLPARIILDDERIAHRISKTFAEVGVTVVLSDLPELDHLITEFIAYIQQAPQTSYSDYLHGGELEPSLLHKFCAGAANMAEAEPWTWLDDNVLFTLKLQQWGFDTPCAMVIGQCGIERGLLIFDSLDICRSFQQLSSFAQSVGSSSQPNARILAINYERGADLNASARKQIMRHGWPLVSPDDHPVLHSAAPNSQLKQPDVNDYLLSIAMLDAIFQLTNNFKEQFNTLDPIRLNDNIASSLLDDFVLNITAIREPF